MKRKQFSPCAVFLVALSIGGSAWAAENVAATSGLWSNAGNWSLSTVPTTADDRAKVWGGATVTVDYAAPDVSGLRLGSNLSNRGKVVIDSGASLRNQGTLEISGGQAANGKSRLNVAGTFINDGIMNIGHVNGATTPGGALQVTIGGVVTANNTVNIGNGANGVVEITGGTFTQVGNFDTFVGSGSGMSGELFMDGGTYTTGDDLILAGNGNNRTGKVDLNGGATLNVTDSIFAGLAGPYDNNSGEIVVSDATLSVGTQIRLGRANTQSMTLTLDDADALVETWFFTIGDGGSGTVNLLDGELSLVNAGTLDNHLVIGSEGVVNFEKGVLAWNDNTTEDELEAFWVAGDFVATKNGANTTAMSALDSISYTQDLGDGYTAVVGLEGGVAKTFVIPEPSTVSLLMLSSGLLLWVRKRLLL